MSNNFAVQAEVDVNPAYINIHITWDTEAYTLDSLAASIYENPDMWSVLWDRVGNALETLQERLDSEKESSDGEH